MNSLTMKRSPGHSRRATLPLPGGGLSESQSRCMGGLSAPIIPIQTFGRNQNVSREATHGEVSSEPQPLPQCHEPAPKSHRVAAVTPEMWRFAWLGGTAPTLEKI
jgi:hypothetical protein